MNLSFFTEDQNVFFTSDTHFEHRKILDFYPHRPFSAIAEMNESLVQNWNTVVNEEDIVFHLGDVYFSGGKEILCLLDQLKGRKYLVPGNHDDSKKLRKLAEFFTILPKEVTAVIDARIMTLCHYPLALPGLVLHGHMHGTSVFQTIPREERGNPTAVGKKQAVPLQSVDVGVDAWKYTPVSWKKIWALV